MKNLKHYDEDYAHIPQFTISETHDCISVIANAIAIAIKQNADIRDVIDYLDHWCNISNVPQETRQHIIDVAVKTLTSLGYEG